MTSVAVVVSGNILLSHSVRAVFVSVSVIITWGEKIYRFCFGVCGVVVVVDVDLSYRRVHRSGTDDCGVGRKQALVLPWLLGRDDFCNPCV